MILFSYNKLFLNMFYKNLDLILFIIYFIEKKLLLKLLVNIFYLFIIYFVVIKN